MLCKSGRICQQHVCSWLFFTPWPLSKDESLPFYNKLQWCLCFLGGDHGSAGAEVSGSQQDCLLHHGGGRRRETPDRPSRSIQANVSAWACAFVFHGFELESRLLEMLSLQDPYWKKIWHYVFRLPVHPSCSYERDYSASPRWKSFNSVHSVVAENTLFDSKYTK